MGIFGIKTKPEILIDDINNIERFLKDLKSWIEKRTTDQRYGSIINKYCSDDEIESGLNSLAKAISSNLALNGLSQEIKNDHERIIKLPENIKKTPEEMIDTEIKKEEITVYKKEKSEINDFQTRTIIEMIEHFNDYEKAIVFKLRGEEDDILKKYGDKALKEALFIIDSHRMFSHLVRRAEDHIKALSGKLEDLWHDFNMAA